MMNDYGIEIPATNVRKNLTLANGAAGAHRDSLADRRVNFGRTGPASLSLSHACTVDDAIDARHEIDQMASGKARA